MLFNKKMIVLSLMQNTFFPSTQNIYDQSFQLILSSYKIVATIINLIYIYVFPFNISIFWFFFLYACCGDYPKFLYLIIRILKKKYHLQFGRKECNCFYTGEWDFVKYNPNNFISSIFILFLHSKYLTKIHKNI